MHLFPNTPQYVFYTISPVRSLSVFRRGDEMPPTATEHGGGGAWHAHTSKSTAVHERSSGERSAREIIWRRKERGVRVGVFSVYSNYQYNKSVR